MNSLGQVVIKRAIGNSAQTLNLAALKAGVYLIHVVGKSTNLVRKILLK